MSDFFGGLLSSWWSVFSSWVLTPTGALLTLLLIASGVVSWFGNIGGRSNRLLLWLIGLVAAVWTLWILGGVLGRMGAPIRQLLSWLPLIVNAACDFLLRLIQTAG